VFKFHTGKVVKLTVSVKDDRTDDVSIIINLNGDAEHVRLTLLVYGIQLLKTINRESGQKLL